MINKTYTFHTDPSHGWLEVPYLDLMMYCFPPHLSGYSYCTNNGETYFLEEDCDAPLFMSGLRENGVKFSIEEVYSDGNHGSKTHWIRGLSKFDFV